jgi:hypothetical protein
MLIVDYIEVYVNCRLHELLARPGVVRRRRTLVAMPDAVAPIPTVLAGIPLPPVELAVLLRVAASTLQQWRAGTSSPTGWDERRIRLVGLLVDELRRKPTPAGIAAWFQIEHPQLGARPVDLLDDTAATAPLVDAAAGANRSSANQS